MEFLDQYILISLSGTDLQIRYYGIIIVFAMIVAAIIAGGLAQRRNLDPDHIWGALTWAIFPGIIFARLWFVLFPPVSWVAGCSNPASGLPCKDTAWFMANFFNLNDGAIAIWSGGLSIFGAVLGGLLGAWLYFGPLHNPVGRVFYYLFLPITVPLNFIGWLLESAYKLLRRQPVTRFRVETFSASFPAQGMPIGPWLDIAAVVLPLAQAIGRWANFINQELYGTVTTLPWGIPIDAAHRVGEYRSLVDYPASTLFHPLFLYESLWSLAAFFVLYSLFTRQYNRFRVGDFFLMYLIQYSFIRFLLEFLRVEQALVAGVNSSQVFTGVVFVVALLVFLARRSGATSAATNATAKA